MHPLLLGLTQMYDQIETLASEEAHPMPTKPTNYTKTESILHDMLTENTGVAMCDSGMYGRHWEKNRSTNDFRNKPYANVDEGCISLSLFHYLNEKLTYDGKMNAKFKRFSTSLKMKDEGWLTCMEEFVEKYGCKNDYMGYGTENSYNGECSLDQTIQFSWFTDDNDISYIILQVHGGADVRGGYSEPKVFRAEIDDFISYNRMSASCSCGYCDSDNGGYSWYDSDCFNTPDDGFPKEWSWSKRLGKYFCRECKQEVNFG